MNMIDYVKKVLIGNYANFNGRASRAEYWWFALAYFIVYFVLAMLIQVSVVFSILLIVFLLGIIVPLIAVGVRRMHDVGKSGWYILIPIYSLILACTEGTAGPNEYGPDPYSPVEQGFDFEQKKLHP